MIIGRRHLLGAAALLAGSGARAAVPFDPPAALLEAAKREGGFINYTAQIEDLELETIAAFNKRFPFVKVEIVHLPGGQLIEKIRAEVATNKLAADLIDHSEPGLIATMNGAFRDYQPPNAADYIAATIASPRIWPRLTAGWCIAWNKELIKEKPRAGWISPGPCTPALWAFPVVTPADRHGRVSCLSGRCWARITGRSRHF